MTFTFWGILACIVVVVPIAYAIYTNNPPPSAGACECHR